MSPKPRSVPILQVMFPSRSSYSVGMDGGMHWGTDHFKLQTLWKQGQWSSGVQETLLGPLLNSAWELTVFQAHVTLMILVAAIVLRQCAF